MVKKLLKHEFIYYFRSFGMFLPIVVVIGVMARVFRFFEDSNIINQLAIVSSTAMLMVSCIALVLLSTVACVVRFYKNMYSAEGYLTFTLPVTNTEHLFAKLLSAMAFQAVCLMAAGLAIIIAFSGEILTALVENIIAALDGAIFAFGAWNLMAFAVELLLVMVLGVAGNLLLYYACITVGQTAKKNRILMAFVAYFVYYIATQVIGTVVAMLVMVLGVSGVLDGLGFWLEENYILAAHLYFGVLIVITGALTAAFWFVTQKVMTKKLNLE